MADTEPYIVINSFSHSDSVPITDAVDKWQSPVKTGDTTFTHNWAEIGARYKNIGVGYLRRYDFELNYSPQTAQFYHIVNNKQSLPIGKQYDLFLAVKHIYHEGVRLSYHVQINPKLGFTIGGSYLKGLKLTDGELHGTATALAKNDYDFSANVDYLYSKDVLFERKVKSPEGIGYSIDTFVTWNIWRELLLRLNVVDLYGRMHWYNAPNTTAVATSDVKEYDQDGYVKYNPVLHGYETNRDFTQTFDPQLNLQLSYPVFKNIDFIGQLYRVKPATFYQIGGEYAPNAYGRIRLLYMFDTHAVSLGYLNKYVNFTLTSDSLDIDKSYTFAVNMRLSVVIE